MNQRGFKTTVFWYRFQPANSQPMEHASLSSLSLSLGLMPILVLLIILLITSTTNAATTDIYDDTGAADDAAANDAGG